MPRISSSLLPGSFKSPSGQRCPPTGRYAPRAEVRCCDEEWRVLADLALTTFRWPDGIWRPSFRSPFEARRPKSGRSMPLWHFPRQTLVQPSDFGVVWLFMLTAARRGRLRHPSRRMTFIPHEHRSVSNTRFPASSHPKSPAVSIREYIEEGVGRSNVDPNAWHVPADQPIVAT